MERGSNTSHPMENRQIPKDARAFITINACAKWKPTARTSSARIARIATQEYHLPLPAELRHIQMMKMFRLPEPAAWPFAIRRTSPTFYFFFSARTREKEDVLRAPRVAVHEERPVDETRQAPSTPSLKQICLICLDELSEDLYQKHGPHDWWDHAAANVFTTNA